MNKIFQPPDKDEIAKLARAATNKNAAFFFDRIRAANRDIDKDLRVATSESDIYRLQGAGQVLDELVELIDKAGEWIEELKE